MNLRVPAKEYSYSKITVPKSPTAHRTSKSCLFLSESEFPSLSESSGKEYVVANNSKYSDKLKSASLVHSSLLESSDVNHSNLKSVKVFQADKLRSSEKQVDLKKGNRPSIQISDKISLNQSRKQVSNFNKLSKEYNKIDMSSKGTACAKQEVLCYSSDVSTKIQKQAQPVLDVLNKTSKNSQSKAILENQQGNADNVKMKKKKRKSKVKRQIALQTGKIALLTPEIHLKILNQSSIPKSPHFGNDLTFINNEEEYPQLGTSFKSTSPKKNSSKKVGCAANNAQKRPSDIHVPIEVPKPMVRTEDIAYHEKVAFDKKEKSEKVVHPSDLVTVSIVDVISKVKTKDLKNEISVPLNSVVKKVAKKKDFTIYKPHNLLDSSPAIKRGKEREIPKPKKPSHLKKIILLDRKLRKEQFLILRNNVGQGEEIEGDASQTSAGYRVETIEIFDDAKAAFFENTSKSSPEESTEMNPFVIQHCGNDQDLDYGSLDLEKSGESSEINSNPKVEKSDLMNSVKDNSTGRKSSMQDILSSTSVIEDSCLVSNENQHLAVIEDSCIVSNENQHSVPKGLLESCSLKQNLDNKSSDSMFKFISGAIKELEISNKEKASKIILHTRNFREYCNHLISKEIDDAVFALLDDLARFQDRMHQKDPIKGRMKRRMVYGMKEIKKHIKLKKLKCIIIAPDLENIESAGGLNDVLRDIKLSAAEHHIPCIFALGRKTLGKVCHKSVPVSCVGIFNYEGSEVNFKKVIQLQIQSTKDYFEIKDKVSQHITEEQASTFIKVKKEAPEILHSLRSDLLRELFLPSAVDSKCQNRLTNKVAYKEF